MRSASRFPLSLAALTFCALLSSSLPAQEAAGGGLGTENEKMLYTLGMALAQQIGQFGITESELSLVQRGLSDAVMGRSPLVDLQTYGPKLQGFAQSRVGALAAVEKTKSAEFVVMKAGETGAVRTDSGLVITEITAGTGASPTATDTVKVHYHGTLRDGNVFDSSVDRGEPVEFALNQVIPCWTEGLQLMKVGGKSRLVCPSDIAYGDQGRPGIPGGAALVFEVELLEIPAAAGS
jgi:FKBP-type peptidyl-prolyl cis-trans isomerase